MSSPIHFKNKDLSCLKVHFLINFNFLFHNSHDKYDRQIKVSNQTNQIESMNKVNSQTSMECCRASAALIFWYVINTSAYYLVKSTLAPTPDQWCHCQCQQSQQQQFQQPQWLPVMIPGKKYFVLLLLLQNLIFTTNFQRNNSSIFQMGNSDARNLCFSKP